MKMSKLENGSEEREEDVFATMDLLRQLWNLGISAVRPANDLVAICKNDSSYCPSGESIKLLQELRLLPEDGKPTGIICKVVLSAITGKGDRICLRSPFESSHLPVIVTNVTGKQSRDIDLGDEALSEIAGNAIKQRGQQTQSTHHLKWEGTKIPKGAFIEGIEIAWTQNELATDVDGKRIGTYIRLVEFGGRTGGEHQMLIFVP
jgi:hypothetical protein